MKQNIMLAKSFIRCFRCGLVGHNIFQCRRAVGQTCYRCREYGHKANNCRSPNRGSGQFRSRKYNTRQSNQRFSWNRQTNNRDNQNAVAEPQPLVQPRMFPSPPKLAQFKLMPPLPDYIPCSDMWNPYANFPTVHHSFREGQWWVNRSSFEIDKYYRELEESEKVVADARRRGVPLAKVTEESEKGYEGENPESLFKALRNFQNDGDQLLSISWEIVAEASPDKGQVTTILA